MNVALVGATGVVGGAILRVLEERSVPVDRLFAYASRARADGVTFRGASLPVMVASRERLLADAPDVAFFASSDDASADLAEPLVDAGTVVIDNSATFRLTEGVPLVIPEVNPASVQSEHRLFPVANCT
ncbi:MAG: aspartate-semialdehyde dehydrogenase, partial [Candidatus Eremiobacteraeota bacterium]|nr:aspartate-semialdehyde dehydrogenase [Candidatus Eremiobacteraeota bacterium]